jgi:EAL domain-containing protein (putative c-di-GMP-specific phosphodiesterase class I)
VVQLGQILHLDTVAGGVESRAQAIELTLLGCRAGQGFHFAPPMTAADLDPLIVAGARPSFPRSGQAALDPGDAVAAG